EDDEQDHEQQAVDAAQHDLAQRVEAERDGGGAERDEDERGGDHRSVVLAARAVAWITSGPARNRRATAAIASSPASPKPSRTSTATRMQNGPTVVPA